MWHEYIILTVNHTDLEVQKEKKCNVFELEMDGWMDGWMDGYL